MAVEVLLPKLGLTMREGTIEEWLVAPGDQVRPGDPILRLATDKVDVEVEAEGAGQFQPVVEAGTTLEPGTLIGWLLAPGEQAQAPGGPAQAAEGPEPNGTRRLLASPNARRAARRIGLDLSTLKGSGPGGRIVSEDVEEALAAPSDSASAEPGTTAPEQGAPIGPLLRRDARALGVDLSEVRGTGPGGTIRREDVAAAARQEAAPQSDRRQGLPDQVIPLTGMRGTIASRMHSSLHEMAQLTHGFEVAVDRVVELRAALKREWASIGLDVPSLNDFVVSAAARALRDHPGLNACVEQDGIHLYPEIHVGVAVAVDGGLLVPVVRDAASLSLTRLAAETRRLAGAGRQGRLTLSELEGATFVVSSLGGYGVDFFTPIINPGNVAILGVGRLRDGVRWEDDQPRRSRVLTLSLTFDHRAVDGAPAAGYLTSIAALLAQPLRLLAG